MVAAGRWSWASYLLRVRHIAVAISPAPSAAAPVIIGCIFACV
jgi:hypothetical protein